MSYGFKQTPSRILLQFLLLLAPSLCNAGTSMFSIPYVDIRLSGGLANYEFQLNPNYHEYSSLSGIGPTGTITLALYPSSYFNLAWSAEILPINTIKAKQATVSYYDNVDNMNWQFVESPQVQYIPLLYTTYISGHMTPLSFCDLFFGAGLALNHDIYYYQKTTTSSNITLGGEPTTSTFQAPASNFFNAGLFTTVGADLFVPSFPSVCIGVSLDGVFCSNTGFNDASLDKKTFLDIQNVSFAPFRAKAYISYSFRKINTLWVTKRESAKNFKVFADKLGKNLPENSETLFSLMSELDKLYTSLIDVTRSQTKAFNSLKLRLFVKWVALQNSQYTSLSSLDEVKSIKGKYNELCKIGIDQIPNAALLLASHLDSLETIMQLAVEHRNDSLRVAQAKQRVEDSLAAIPTSLLLSQAHDLMTSQYFKKALVTFRKFTDAYSIIPSAQRLFIDTSGLNSSISESFYQLANASFYGIDMQKNIPEALKYFQSSRNYGNPVVDDKIVLCRLISPGSK